MDLHVQAVATGPLLSYHVAWGRDHCCPTTWPGDETTALLPRGLGTRPLLSYHVAWGRDRCSPTTWPGDETTVVLPRGLGTRPLLSYHVAWGRDHCSPAIRPGDETTSCITHNCLEWWASSKGAPEGWLFGTKVSPSCLE